METAAVLTQNLFSTPSAKTAHGLVRGPSRYRIVAVLDAPGHGHDAGELLDGQRRGIPVLKDLDTLLQSGVRPDWLVVGVATSGGVLPDDLKPVLAAALRLGIGVVNGLHDFVADDAELAAAAAASGARVIDIRRPRPRRELHFHTGAIDRVRAPRLAVLGTDCALGKRTTSQLLVAACRRHDLRAEMVYTGQTGWLQGSRYGFVLDATANDFVAGELEHAIVSCDRELHPDLIVLEGQSALRNPAGPCGAELMLSGGAHGVILQHAPARRFFDDQEHLHHEIPSLASELELIGMYGSRVLAIALNHEHLAAADRDAVRAQIERETGSLAFYPLLDGFDRVLPLVRAYLDAEASR
ncbi:MAG: DUF1611 domain-containing protein [Planctomycetes bacterium]|nr:DUF1611 domain-containing protein [Planctomycetota bacterium]